MTDRKDKNGGTVVQIKNFVVHPDRDSITYSNDISIITLKEKVEITEKIKPICIGDLTEIVQNDEVRSD